MKTPRKLAIRWTKLLGIALAALVPAPVWAEVLTVPSNGSRVMSQPLLSGCEYVIQASGTWFYNGPGNPTYVADAVFQTYNGGATWVPSGTLQVTNGPWNWLGTTGTFNPSHIYQIAFLGTNQPLTFFIADSLYSDNSGSLQVSIVQVTNPHCATAAAAVTNGLLVGVTVTDYGYGYTNTPLVRLIGGGGSGAEAVAVVTNGGVFAVNVLDAGSGYTNAPGVVIEPPFVVNPVLSIAPMSFLAFSNLTLGGVYQLQESAAWYWSNQPVSFTATNALYSQMVAGVAGSGDYRLALNPVPAQAFATAVVDYGFVVHVTVTSGGSGYVTAPAVAIVGGGGSNATAVSQISGGVVTNITITSTGTGYTNTPRVQIAQPPAAAVSPTVFPVMRLDSTTLAPFDNYQIQFKRDLGGAWGNWNGGLFSPTDVNNSQYLFITNGVGFFRLQYVP